VTREGGPRQRRESKRFQQKKKGVTGRTTMKSKSEIKEHAHSSSDERRSGLQAQETVPKSGGGAESLLREESKTKIRRMGNAESKKMGSPAGV